MVEDSVETPLRILAVDNEPSVTTSLRFVFSDPRYDLTCVASGPAALSRLDEVTHPFDVILVDEKMPGVTGLELVQAMRRRGIQGEIIVVSAHLTSETREAYEHCGVQTMLTKPFNVSDLRAAVDRLRR